MNKKRFVSLGVIIAVVFALSSPAPAQNEGLLLETIGALSAQGLYLTYTAIGTLADSFQAKAYDAKFTLQILEEYINLTNGAKGQLDKLISENAVEKNDAAYINKLIDTYDLLIDEANAFKNFVNTGVSKDADKFQKKRQAAWKNIADLLGIK